MPRVSHKTVTTSVTTSEWDQRELLTCLGVIHKDHQPDPEEEITVTLTPNGTLIVKVTTTEEEST